MASSKFPTLVPDLQISFYYRLKIIKDQYLHGAMRTTVGTISIKTIDDELNNLVPSKYLNKIAMHGLRGELIFPIPAILNSNPYLLGYYRLLLGFSQKEFYSKGPFGKFKALEEKGKISRKAQPELTSLCISLIDSACLLIKDLDTISQSTLHELQLLTIGPQLRGSKNNEFGRITTQKTFNLIKSIVTPYIVNTTPNSIILTNDSGRNVRIEFASDPDIQIIEEMKSQERGLVSIEIKGGTDISNIHNRIGEAEKSHQKAKKRGYYEFMTILRVNIDDYSMLKQESPTTSHFFNLDKISDTDELEYHTFKDILSSMLSISV